MRSGREMGHKRVQRRATGAVEGHSRGAPLHPLLPWPEGHKAGGWGKGGGGGGQELTWRGDGKAPEEDAVEGGGK